MTIWISTIYPIETKRGTHVYSTSENSNWGDYHLAVAIAPIYIFFTDIIYVQSIGHEKTYMEVQMYGAKYH